jgi:hypothetical protein
MAAATTRYPHNYSLHIKFKKTWSKAACPIHTEIVEADCVPFGRFVALTPNSALTRDFGNSRIVSPIGSNSNRLL